jgi:DNA (cytosine-5)-methyltransferase 1
MFAEGRQPWRTAAECIAWSIPCPSIFERRRPLAESTLRRIALGLKRYVIEAAEPFIVTCNHAGGFRGQSLRDPLCTVTAARDAHGLIVPAIAPCQVAIDNKSSGPRATWPITSPTRTITLENRHALVSAFLAKHYGGVVGHDPRRPIGTVTAIDHHSVVAAHLLKLYGTSTGADARAPMPTVTSGGNHIAEVRAFLVSYYGQGIGQSMRNPMRTVTTRDRMGLVTIANVDYQIVDIGLRMLTPRELAKAQGFPDDYLLPETKSAAVAMIGNSVPPPLAAALARANCPDLAVKEAVESGISSLEQEFMAWTVMPSGQTVGDKVLPRIAEAYTTGKNIPLLEFGG